MVGVAGFEPASDRVKVCCLTAWLHPSLHRTLYHTIPEKSRGEYIFYCFNKRIPAYKHRYSVFYQ